MIKDTKDIIKGTLVNFFGLIINSVNILFFIFLSNFYGARIVGIFIFSQTTVDIISKLGLLGFDNGILTVASKSIAEKNEGKLYKQVSQAILIGTIASFLVSIAFTFAAPIIFDNFYPRLELASSLRIMGPTIFFLTLSLILLHATRAYRIMKYQVIVKNGIEPLLLASLSVLFYFLNFDERGPALAFLIASIVGAIFSAYYFSKLYSCTKIFKTIRNLSGIKELAKFVIPMGINDITWLVLQKLDLYILGRFADSVTIGVFTLAQNIAMVFKKFKLSFDPILISVISAADQAKDLRSLSTQYKNVMRWLLIINITVFSFVLFAGKPMMQIFGKDFTTGQTVLVLLSAAVIINTSLGVSEQFILIKKPFINVVNALVTILFAAILNLFLIPRLGMEGAATATVISFLFLNIARIAEVHYLYKLNPLDTYFFKALFSAFPASVFCYLTKFALETISHPLLLCNILIVLFTLTYFSCLFLLGANKDDLQIFYKIKKKLFFFQRNNIKNNFRA